MIVRNVDCVLGFLIAIVGAILDSDLVHTGKAALRTREVSAEEYANYK